MDKPQKPRRENLLAKVEHLEARLAEADATLKAIRNGEVDALVVATAQGDRVFTLTGAEKPYRIMVESMSEGALTLGLDGTILYCNPCFAATLRTPIENIIGNSIYPFINPEERTLFERFIRLASRSDKKEIFLQDAEGTFIPVLLSLSDLGNMPPVSICLLATDITARKQAEEDIRASLREKEILLRELHHRVKNNLQVISGLLDLQARSSGNPKLIEMLNESQRRIRSMALIHERLYASKDLARIDMAGYVRALSQELFHAYKIDRRKIDLIIQMVGDVHVDINKAIPCGLILNELVSNAFKHAFPGEGPGELRITIHETKTKDLEIIVRDNGLGLPDDVEIHQPRSMGLYLVNGLVKTQLEGQIEVRRDSGTEFRIQFPL